MSSTSSSGGSGSPSNSDNESWTILDQVEDLAESEEAPAKHAERSLGKSKTPQVPPPTLHLTWLSRSFVLSYLYSFVDICICFFFLGGFVSAGSPHSNSGRVSRNQEECSDSEPEDRSNLLTKLTHISNLSAFTYNSGRPRDPKGVFM